ncbi:UDP-N-acetyl-alpha-D-glucosamine C6 dehydratase [Vagococcus luciliae]|uniref:UDP-N-acetyl-alpha-D-glucosamine C6 dehydratase n=2 Tax=Vagococcus luciliae TaxID=2920380 RepID=A0ABY5P1V1_9ENTE|nr:UDP-N-acetyl-alpha-D-glucosamine C6 dehydratase [Vagococcus luciliae]
MYQQKNIGDFLKKVRVVIVVSRKVKMSILIGVDASIIILANIIVSFYTNFLYQIDDPVPLRVIGLHLVLYLLFGSVFKVFNRLTRYTSINAILSIFFAVSASSILEYIILGFYTSSSIEHLQILLAYFIVLLAITSSRVAWRLIVDYLNMYHYKGVKKCDNAFIIGAGDGGELLYNTVRYKSSQLGLNFKGFIDDDVNKKNTYLSGLKVVGSIDELPMLVKEYEVKVLTVAIPSMTATQYEHLLDVTRDLDVTINSIPSIEELAMGEVSVTKLREIDVVDLLGRDEVKLDMDSIKNQLANKTVLVTGAGGSIGSEICRQVMAFSPKKIVLLGHGENSIYLIEKELRQHYADKNTEIVPVIADVRDAKRIFDVMNTHKPFIVYHAAAHKHVPLMEYNPVEALKNNIYGTKHVAEAALANDVTSFVMVSTDKAVKPPNVMGATKRIAEMIVTGLNGKGTTKFSAVRFGNVLGSRGSVVPLFKEQVAKGGPVTVTDFRMTRYFMTIPEASRLVIQSGTLAKGGEIFILDMGEPVKIVDLAKKVIKLSGYTENEIQIIESGIRPGEKLYEELLVDKERSKEQVHEKIFVGNVNGFTYDEVMKKIEELPEDYTALAKELVLFANQSSEE